MSITKIQAFIFSKVLFVIFISLIPTQVIASPILFFSGQLVEKNSISIILQDFAFNFKEKHHSPANSKLYINNSICIIEYGTNIENLFLQVTPQYNFKELKFKVDDKAITRKTYGMGDTFFQVIWRPLNYVKGDIISRLFVFGGVIAPTGKFNRQDKYKEQLGDIIRPLQPGTGNWALDLEVYYGYYRKNFEVNVGIAYNRFFKGHRYRFGSLLTYYFSCLPTIYTFKIDSKDLSILAGLEFMGTVSQKDRDHGSNVKNTGGNTLDFLPAVQLSYPNFVLSFGYLLRGYASLNRDVDLPEPVELTSNSWTLKAVYYTSF